MEYCDHCHNVLCFSCSVSLSCNKPFYYRYDLGIGKLSGQVRVLEFCIQLFPPFMEWVAYWHVKVWHILWFKTIFFDPNYPIYWKYNHACSGDKLISCMSKTILTDINILHRYRHIMSKSYFSEIPERLGYRLGIAKSYRVGSGIV